MKKWSCLVLVVPLILSGCATSQPDVQQLQSRVDTLERRNETLQDQKSDLRDRLESIQKTNRKLATKLESIQDQNYRIAKSFLQKVPEASVYQEDLNVVLGLEPDVLFSLGSPYLSQRGRETLDRVASVIQEFPGRKIRVEGHTDTWPIDTSRYPSNWELSTHRATNVIHELLDNGVSPDRIYAAGYSKYQPIRPNNSPRNRARNRRVEISLIVRDVAPELLDPPPPGESSN